MNVTAKIGGIVAVKLFIIALYCIVTCVRQYDMAEATPSVCQYCVNIDCQYRTCIGLQYWLDVVDQYRRDIMEATLCLYWSNIDRHHWTNIGSQYQPNIASNIGPISCQYCLLQMLAGCCRPILARYRGGDALPILVQY